jgi:AcrR family transcriptional regulator
MGHVANRGRPRSFDRDAALRRAMEAFWTKGYDAVSLEELLAAMGRLTPPSFYAAFGSKEQVFREAMELYCHTEGAPISSALADGATARASIEAMLLTAADALTQRGKPCGCMVSTNWSACSPRHAAVRDLLGELRTTRRKRIQDRLRHGVRAGDVPPQADISAMARFYSMTLDGFSIEARDGSSRKVLRTLAKGAMAAWDGFLCARDNL